MKPQFIRVSNGRFGRCIQTTWLMFFLVPSMVFIDMCNYMYVSNTHRDIFICKFYKILGRITFGTFYSRLVSIAVVVFRVLLWLRFFKTMKAIFF